MENYKAQGRGAEAVGELSVPIKLLSLGKFREAEVIAEQYLLSHADDPLAHLVAFAAHAKLKYLAPFVTAETDKISGDEYDMIDLLVAHRAEFFEFFRLAPREQGVASLKYFVAYAEVLKAPSNWVGEVFSKDIDGIEAWYSTLCSYMYTYLNERYAEYSFYVGSRFLFFKQYESARAYFENALEAGYNAVECRYHILFCAMKIRGKADFAQSDVFSVTMPEYINLLLALSDNEEEMTTLSAMAEETEKAIQTRQKEGDKKHFCKPLLSSFPPAWRTAFKFAFWVLSIGFGLYFLFFLGGGAGWEFFVHLTPFMHIPEGASAMKISLIISTVAVVICFVMQLYGFADECATTARKKVLNLLLNFVFCFAVWYLGLAFAYWFRGLGGFWVVVLSILVNALVGFISIGCYAGLSELRPGFFDKADDSLVYACWASGYNRMMVGFFYLCVGAYASFILFAKDTGGIHIGGLQIGVLPLLCALFFLGVGAYFFIMGMRAKGLSQSRKLNGGDLGEILSQGDIAKTEFSSSVVSVLLAFVLFGAATLMSELLFYGALAPSILLLLSGVFGLIISAKNKS